MKDASKTNTTHKSKRWRICTFILEDEKKENKVDKLLRKQATNPPPPPSPRPLPKKLTNKRKTTTTPPPPHSPHHPHLTKKKKKTTPKVSSSQKRAFCLLDNQNTYNTYIDKTGKSFIQTRSLGPLAGGRGFSSNCSRRSSKRNLAVNSSNSTQCKGGRQMRKQRGNEP